MKNQYILLIAALIAILALPVSAHPGKTDKYGGHYDNETGEYHYHHGYPAHEHVNGVCPYDFDDRTGENSGTSTGSTATKKPEYHVETPDPLSPAIADTKSISTPTPTVKSTSTQNKSFNLAFLFFPCAAVAGGIGYFIKSRIKKDRIKQADRANKTNPVITEPPPLPPPEPEPTPETMIVINLPEGYSLDEQNLPFKTNRKYGWGREFNVYVTVKGKCYHRRSCNALKYSRFLTHRYIAISKGYKPCPYCRPKDYIDEWFVNSTTVVEPKENEQLSLLESTDTEL